MAARKSIFILLGVLLLVGVWGRSGFSMGRRPVTPAPDGAAQAQVQPPQPAMIGEAETEQGRVTKAKLAEVISKHASVSEYPSEVTLPGESSPVIVQYSFDARLQEQMEALMESYRPDFGAFVAIDARTGRVLAMVSHEQKPPAGEHVENLALRSTFPSASVFKVVTAAAAISERHFSADTVVPFNGRNHTLYRSNILRDKVTRWTRYPSLKEAFANSINTVFAKIGAFTVGPEKLRSYADRFGFDRRIASDILIPEGHASIPQDPTNAWGVAEAASGFTRLNTMSPLQGALMAAAVANDGVMMEPFIVQGVHSTDGSEVYAAKPRVASVALDAKAASEIRALMRETVTHGTSRKSFRGFFRREFADLQVGGKTGSLTGLDPRGKYDWFIGYADDGTQRLAFAALTIHQKLWRVKSSYLGRRAIETYFKSQQASDTTVASAKGKHHHRRRARHLAAVKPE